MFGVLIKLSEMASSRQGLKLYEAARWEHLRVSRQSGEDMQTSPGWCLQSSRERYGHRWCPEGCEKKEYTNGAVKLELTPPCVQVKPTNEQELKSAIRSVLTVLQVFHATGFVHRDIRWQNVLKSRPNSWLFADFEEAAQPGPLDTSNRQNQHLYLAPEVLALDPQGKHQYGTNADVWAVGTLMRECNAASGEALSDTGQAFRDLLLSVVGTRPSAAEALDQAWLQQYAPSIAEALPSSRVLLDTPVCVCV